MQVILARPIAHRYISTRKRTSVQGMPGYSRLLPLALNCYLSTAHQ